MIVAIDLETTGLSPKNDKILEIALVKFDEITFEIIEEFATLIDPEIHIPELNSGITNIYDEDVKDAPKWGKIREKVSLFIGENPILGHNVYFDRSFLIENGISIEDNAAIDTFLIANFLMLGEKSLNLEYLCQVLGIDLEGAHRALNDTKATIILFQKLLGKLDKNSLQKQEIIGYILNKSTDTGMHFVYDRYLNTLNIPKDKENFIKKIEKLLPKTKKYTTIVVDQDQEDFNFDALVDTMGSLEKRENQKNMSLLVDKSLRQEKLSVIEAPTGIGKTFAYLLPAIIHSVQTGEQVFLSTSTKALQDQIYYKDLKKLQDTLSVNFSYSKLKGKANYIGIASFMSFLEEEEESFSHIRASFILKILLWLSLTKDGELDELDYYGQEYSFLYQINADDSLTFSSENIYEEKEFSVRARRQARLTNIVIINNNILFQDIDGENSILSKVENLIIDEAHNLEDVVTKSLEKSCSLSDLEMNTASITKKIKGEKKKLVGLDQKKEILLFELGIVFDIFKNYLSRYVSHSHAYQTILLKSDFFTDDMQEIAESGIQAKINILFIEYIDLLNTLEDSVYIKLSKELHYIENCMDILGKILHKESIEKFICIVTYTDQKGLQLKYTHLNPGVYLKKHLWSKLSSCILTSATLQSNGKFDYINNMLSLETFTFHALATDFDYSQQALLFIPDDLGSIKNNFKNIVFFLKQFFKTVRGNTLVLFTSFFSIKETYSLLDHEMKKQDIQLYAQSIGGGKQKLINFYKKNSDRSILIGTNTFWEGVDIPGENLKYLVIHKVPFMVPSDPIFQARSSLFEDSFMEYSVPKAIIKLKQGFGRLIRTKEDCGIVVFLDDRIYSSSWGEILYSAFPENIKKRKGGVQNFLEILKKSIN